MKCEMESIGAGLMRCKRKGCEVMWFEADGLPLTCVLNQSNGTPYQSVVRVEDHGLMNVRD